MVQKILIVDDEEDITLSLSKLLERQGYSVDAALSAIDALGKIKGGGYRIVITDIMMPDMDGIELLKSIKELDRGIYVIMITAYAGDLDRTISCLKYGAGDFIQKPYENKEILEAVQKAVETLEEDDKARDGKQTIVMKPSVAENFRTTCRENVAQLADAVKKITGIATKISVEGPIMEDIEKFPDYAEGPGIHMMGTYASIYGALSGSTVFLLPLEDAIRLVEILSDKKVDYTDFPRSDDRAVIKEVGGIFSEKCAKKLSSASGSEVKITPSSFVSFISGNFVSFLELHTGRKKQYYFANKLTFQIGEVDQIMGHLLLIFDMRNLRVLNNRFP